MILPTQKSTERQKTSRRCPALQWGTRKANNFAVNKQDRKKIKDKTLSKEFNLERQKR